VRVPSGRPSISGTGTVFAGDDFAYDSSSATATNIVKTPTQAIYAKLPSKSYLAGTNNSDGDIQLDEATGNWPLSTQAKADVRAQSNLAIEDNNLDHLLKVAAVTGDVANNSVIAKVAAKGATADWATFDNTTDSLQAQRENIDTVLEGAPTFADAMNAQHYTVARADKLDNLDMAVSAVRNVTPSLLLNTTISGTPTSQTSFVLNAGPPDNGALNGAIVVVTSSTNPARKAVGLVKSYVASTKTVMLIADPGIYTMASGDSVDVIAAGAAVPLWLAH
jgi:hypothetical protein